MIWDRQAKIGMEFGMDVLERWWSLNTARDGEG
jgi:hypothetical protein